MTSESSALTTLGDGSARRTFFNTLAVLAALLVIALIIWQGVTDHGAPDPKEEGIGYIAAAFKAAVLVFREGLEAVLVLAALTASLSRTREAYWKPVALGAGLALLASVVTWFAVVALISGVSANSNISALQIQAATGLLAIVVLLVIMNWFFHKIYWTGWITYQNRFKKSLVETPGQTRGVVFNGLLLLGFASVYREGFEVVLFLQDLRLSKGTPVVLWGVLIGLAFALMAALVTFVLHYRLPYRKMLVLTGWMLGVVFLAMVGESVQECQLANWLPIHNMPVNLPEWLNTWFLIGGPDDKNPGIPTYEGIGIQIAAAALVLGAYFLARHKLASRRES